MTRALTLALALLTGAGALRVSGTAPPWSSGATYQPAAPEAAQGDLLAGRTDAALTSLPLPGAPARAALGRVLFVPVGVYAVTVAYRLPGVDLRLDLRTLCALLGGDVRVWNDPRLRRLNPGADLPALPVLASALTQPNAASLTVARSCVELGVWPPARLKPTWSAGAVYLRPTLDFLQGDLARPGTLAVFAPNTLPPGAQVAQLQDAAGDFLPPTPNLGLDPLLPHILPARPEDALPPADLPGAYPLRGLIWAAVMQDQAYRGRSVQDGRDLLAWLEGLRASSDATFAAIPPALRRPIRLYYNGQPLAARATTATSGASGT